ncbi:MAG: N-acetylglucosamine kinase [Flavobacteriaceae bacterium]|nr:N-acetylglucosamine kinase [Flavobacteriaceae bacterium]
MILIADGGSTKCDWIVFDACGKILLKTRTRGLNPAVFDYETLQKRLTGNVDLQSLKSEVSKVYFYGAGCGTKRPRLLLKELFELYFINAKVEVKEDTYAAAYAVTSEPGIVCILGTGSNSTYFDGEKTNDLIASLGYILMDEASGIYYGKKLIRDYFYKKMPEYLRKKFETEFNLDADVIKLHIYKKDSPNAYLGTFAEFIFNNERNPYFESVIERGIDDFLTNRVKIFDNHQEVPIHFVGSIAHFSEDIIRKVAKKYNMSIGNIMRRPIDGLIKYHQKLIKINQ